MKTLKKKQQIKPHISICKLLCNFILFISLYRNFTSDLKILVASINMFSLPSILCLELETRTPTTPSHSSPPDPGYNVFQMYSVEALIGSGKVALSGIFSCDMNVRKSSLFFLHDLVQRSKVSDTH